MTVYRLIKIEGKTDSHAQKTGSIMFQLEVLIGKRLGPVNAGTTSAIAEYEVTSLNHEVFDLSR